MAKELILDKWPGGVCVANIGATKAEGGSRSRVIKIGGEVTLPFLFKEGAIANKPVIAYEIWDIAPTDWPAELAKAYKDVFADPLAWAEKCVEEHKAELLCLRLQGAHPDLGNKDIDTEIKLIERLLKKVDVPLIIIGCGDDTKDNLVLPACCEAAKGERCLIGNAVQDSYKTITAAVLADGHNIIESLPLTLILPNSLTF